MAGFFLALQFLTVLPVRRKQTAGDAPRMERALPWFPLVGALLGGMLAAGDWVLSGLFPHDVRDIFLVAATALLTGMLHMDGFIDCCDALLGTRPVERRLEILRDSRVGAYGAVGAALLVLARFVALGALAPPLRALALIAAPALGRWSIVYAVVSYPYARAAGAGSAFQARRYHLLLASLVAIALLAGCSGLAGGYVPRNLLIVAALAALALLVTLGWTRWASRRLGGGLTGDTYGALNELVELSVLFAAPLLARL